MGEQTNKDHLFYLNFYDANNNLALNGTLGASNIVNLNNHVETNRNSEFSMYDGTLTNLANIIQSANFEYELLNKFIANLNVNSRKHDVNINHTIDELDLKNLDNLLVKSKWSIKLSNDIDNGLKSTKFLIEQNSINVKANIIFENCSLECDLCKLNINLNNLTKLFVKIFQLTLNPKIEDMILFVNKYSLISMVLVIEKHKCNMRSSYLQAVLKNFFKCLVDILSSKFLSSLTSLQTEFSNNFKMEEYSKLPNEINSLLENLDNIFYQNKPNVDNNSCSISKSNEKTTPRPDAFTTKNQADQLIQENRMNSSIKSNEIILKAINKRKLQISCPLCSSKVLNMSDHLLKKHLIKDRKQRKSIMDSIRKAFLDMNVKSSSSIEDNTNFSVVDSSTINSSIKVKSGHLSSRKLIKCPICEDNKHFVNISDHLIKIHHLVDSEKRRPILKQIKQRISSKSCSSSNKNLSNPSFSSHNNSSISSILNENHNGLADSEISIKSSDVEKVPFKKINKRKQKKTTKLIRIDEEADSTMKNDNNKNDNLCENNLRDTRVDEFQAQEHENIFDHHNQHHYHHHRHHINNNNNHSPKTTTNNQFNNNIVGNNEKKFDYLAQHSNESNMNEMSKRSELSYNKAIEFLEDHEFEHNHHGHNHNHEPIEHNLEKSQELDKDIEFEINSDDLLNEQTSSLIGDQRCLDSNEHLNEFFENNPSDIRLSNTSNHFNANNTSSLNHSLSISQQLHQPNEHVLNRLVQIEDNLNNLMGSFSSLSEIINKQMRSFSCQLEYTFNEVKSLKNSLLLSQSNQSLEPLINNNNNSNNHLTSNHNNADTLNDLSSNHQVNLNDAFNFDNNNNINNNLNNNNKQICNTDHSSSISSSSSSSSIVNFQHFIQHQDGRMISLESNVIDSFEDENHMVQIHSTTHEAHSHSHQNGHHQFNKNNFDLETESKLSESSETNFYANVDRDFYQKHLEVLAGEKIILRAHKFAKNSSINANNINFDQMSKSIFIDSIKSNNKRIKVKQNL